MYKFIIKIFVWIHNFSYRLLGILVIKENDGIHPKHRILGYHDFFTNNIAPSDRVLDIGCGNGACANAIAKKATQVTGIDISKNNIQIAKEKFSNNNPSYLIGDATVYDFKENFDVIILSNVLEHIENRIEFLKKIKKLAPKILIRVPLLNRDWLSVYKKEKGLEYRLDKTHFIEYSEENFKEEMDKAGLSIENFYVKFGELYAIIKK